MLGRWIAHSEKRGEWHVVGSRGFSAIVSIHTCWTCNTSDHTIYLSVVDVCVWKHTTTAKRLEWCVQLGSVQGAHQKSTIKHLKHWV